MVWGAWLPHDKTSALCSAMMENCTPLEGPTRKALFWVAVNGTILQKASGNSYHQCVNFPQSICRCESSRRNICVRWNKRQTTLPQRSGTIRLLQRSLEEIKTYDPSTKFPQCSCFNRLPEYLCVWWSSRTAAQIDRGILGPGRQVVIRRGNVLIALGTCYLYSKPTDLNPGLRDCPLLALNPTIIQQGLHFQL